MLTVVTRMIVGCVAGIDIFPLQYGYCQATTQQVGVLHREIHTQ